MLPVDFLTELANVHNLTPEQKEAFLEIFSIDKSEKEAITALNLSQDAFRNRMTGIYKKFGMGGRGSGKFRQLLDLLNDKYREANSNRVDKSNLWRIKSAMVLYALEKTLGTFVCFEKKDIIDIPSGLLKTIQDRELKGGRSFEKLTTANIVAATYLDEVFGLAMDSAKGRPEEEYLLRLKKLFDTLDVFSIRNAVCHPNRDFHQSYWYRMAAIATDPVIDKLQFQEVSRAFFDAEAEKLSSPPTEWTDKPQWSLPNNLPKRFEHDITSLIGRTKEIFELKKLIQNKRHNLIAILAPGGNAHEPSCSGRYLIR
jgi:hypothetical protein